MASSRGDVRPVNLTQEQGMLIERRQKVVDALPGTVYRVFSGLGGDRGWPPDNWLWRARAPSTGCWVGSACAAAAILTTSAKETPWTSGGWKL